jgi:hypothetical protein
MLQFYVNFMKCNTGFRFLFINIELLVRPNGVFALAIRHQRNTLNCLLPVPGIFKARVVVMLRIYLFGYGYYVEHGVLLTLNRPMFVCLFLNLSRITFGNWGIKRKIIGG